MAYNLYINQFIVLCCDKSNYEHKDKGCPKMFNRIIGEYFLRYGLNTTESPKVFHRAPFSPTLTP